MDWTSGGKWKQSIQNTAKHQSPPPRKDSQLCAQKVSWTLVSTKVLHNLWKAAILLTRALEIKSFTETPGFGTQLGAIHPFTTRCHQTSDSPLSSTYLVNPQLPHDDVVHCGGHLLPRVVIVALLKHGVNCSCTQEGRRNDIMICIPGLVCPVCSMTGASTLLSTLQNDHL